MVTFSQQLQSRNTIPARATRTERLRQASSNQRLMSRARLEQKRLSNVTTIAEYTSQYNQISSDLQPFFYTPQELEQQRSARINQSKSNVQNQIQQNEQKLTDLQTRYQQSLSEIPNLNPNERSSFKTDVTNEYNRNKAFVEGNLTGLREGLSRLNAGEELTSGDIGSYAKSLAGYTEQREAKYIKGREARISPTITTTPISAEKVVMEKLKGLISSGTEIVRNATGGQSEVQTYSVKGGEKVQVVREQDTGKVYFTDIEGEKKGERILVQG